ncbi:hypothetical protein Micbo1qcDRAFT_199196 [Microdochium bolleyi]|uniref:Uncharacterized protein n=1 Tax=Microdochium bolleyi TaxID=196109 RepID=A0A136JGT5_9PEZI|nr:hypothetical protein Micbo1qcDRAFT_199196 [Microdochium bolleyi]
MRSPVGRFFLRLRNVLLASPPGIWLQKRAAQVGQSAAGGWVKARWARIRPAPRPPPESPSDKVYDIEYGVPDTPIVAELDANQRIGSPGNPAELDGSPRWSPLRWSRSSASSTSFGVVSRVKTWLVASTQPKSGWTKSFRQSKFDSDGRDRPTSFKSSRPTSEKSTYSLRGSADWGLASPASLKVPTAAHITRAHERNNSLADVLDAGAKSKAANDKGKEPEVAAQSFSPLLPPDADVMNRLSAGTFGAGRASQVMEAESTHTTEPVPPWPLRDTLPSSPAQFSSGRRKEDSYINKS